MLKLQNISPAWQQLLNEFVEVDLYEEPFPYWITQKFFSTELYSKMQSMWPAQSKFVPYSRTGRVPSGPYDKRLVMPLNKVGLSSLEGENKTFWDEAALVLQSTFFLERLLGEFFPDKQTPSSYSNLRPDVMLIEDTLGYSLPPHTDAPEKFFTLIVYFAENNDHPELGTSMYTTADESLMGAKEVHHPREKFEKYTVSQYLPNAAFCFLRTDNSFHGVEPLTALTQNRRLMIYTCYIESYPDHFKY